MKKVVKAVLGMLLLFVVVGCSPKEKEKTLTIGITNWVGYSPLFYAEEKGWLPENTKLLKVSSLSENTKLYNHGYIDIMLGTQHEFKLLSSKFNDIKTLSIIDRSNGGDMIMSNKTIKELKSTPIIDAYLEINSVNIIVLEDFMKHYNIPRAQVKLHNISHETLDSKKLWNKNQSTAIVTYLPYNFKHEKVGFKEIISTKDNLEIVVVDIMMTREAVIVDNKRDIQLIKSSIVKAIKASQNNPREYYETVSSFLNISFEEYQEAIKDIIWIDKAKDASLFKRLKELDLEEY